MAWTAKTGRRQRVLNSIVARLLALADLGEDAACRSPWVRFCVLWSLCQADAVVREFVAGSTWNPAGRLWSPAVPMVRYGTEPADALQADTMQRPATELLDRREVLRCDLSYLEGRKRRAGALLRRNGPGTQRECAEE